MPTDELGRTRLGFYDYYQSPEFADEVFGPEWRADIPELQPGHQDAARDECQHSQKPAGSSGGGEFAPKDGASDTSTWTAIKHDWQHRSFEQRFPPATDDPAPGKQYYYHVTPLRRLPDIAVEGLTPYSHSHPISVAPHLESAQWWANRVVGGTDDPPVLLRMPRQAVRFLSHEADDEYDPHEKTAEDATCSYIPAYKLEIYDDGRWAPVTQWAQEHNDADYSGPTDIGDRAVTPTDRQAAEDRLIQQLRAARLVAQQAADETPNGHLYGLTIAAHRMAQALHPSVLDALQISRLSIAWGEQFHKWKQHWMAQYDTKTKSITMVFGADQTAFIHEAGHAIDFQLLDPRKSMGRAERARLPLARIAREEFFTARYRCLHQAGFRDADLLGWTFSAYKPWSPEIREKVKAVVRQYPAPSEYALISVREWLAESIQRYIQGGRARERLQRVAPATYAYLDDTLGAGHLAGYREVLLT